MPFDPLRDAAGRLEGLPAWLIGVHCLVEVIVDRREASVDGDYEAARDAGGRIAAAVSRWQTEAHRPGIYDFSVDTAADSPERCAELIARHIETGPPPTALRALRSSGDPAGGNVG